VLTRVRAAVAEIVDAGWAPGITIDTTEGPDAYLYGEETALLEVINGRQPFPRLAPPWRRGADDVGDHTAQAADIEMAGDSTDADAAPPALVDNVDTLANVPAIVLEGPSWFRSIGTAESPGSIVITVTGRSVHGGVAEVAMGTTLAAAIEQIGGAPAVSIAGVLPGVSGPVVSADRLDTPLTYEAMSAIGSSLGAGAYLVLDAATDSIAVAHGASRFLAVESCGQCVACKNDGKAIAEILDRLRRSEPAPSDLADLTDRLRTITDGARCYLATQHQLVVQSFLDRFEHDFAAHAEGSAAPADSFLVAEIVDLGPGGVVLDEAHQAKQPDWTFDAEDSGSLPAEQLDQLSGEAGRTDAQPTAPT